MGQHSVVILSRNRSRRIEEDPKFGANLIQALQLKRNANVPERGDHTTHDTQLGETFGSNATLFVRIEDGSLVRLTGEEALCLEGALKRFRKRQAKLAKTST